MHFNFYNMVGFYAWVSTNAGMGKLVDLQGLYTFPNSQGHNLTFANEGIAAEGAQKFQRGLDIHFALQTSFFFSWQSN